MTNDELLAENKQLRAENAELKQRLADLEAVVQNLKEQLEAAQRAGKRQATPFSKGAPKATPKKPGRKKGHRAAHRARARSCGSGRRGVVARDLSGLCGAGAGRCGAGAISGRHPAARADDRYPVQRAYRTLCAVSAANSRATPDQTSDALGAAAIQIGPNALGLAAEMKHGLGVSYGKVARLLETSLGLRVDRSTVARADERLANRLAPTYQQLLLRLRTSEVVHADETGWKVAGQKAWLWVFTNDDLSVYTIDPTRAHEVVERILGEDFAGVLGCDCFLAYDALKTYTQSKCAGHLLRRCAEISESKSGRAVRFSQQVARLLRAAITVKQRHLEAKTQRARLRRGVWPLGSRVGSVAGRALHRPGQRPLRQTLAQTTPASVDLSIRGRHGPDQQCRRTRDSACRPHSQNQRLQSE